jgi:hypothetical protein
MVLSFFTRYVDSAIADPEGAKNLAGKCPPPDSNPLEMCSLEKITPASQDNSQRLEPQIQVPQTQSASHPRAQRNAFRRRDARLQSRLFVLENFRLNLVALIAASHHVQNPPFSDLSPPDDSAT